MTVTIIYIIKHQFLLVLELNSQFVKLSNKKRPSIRK